MTDSAQDVASRLARGELPRADSLGFTLLPAAHAARGEAALPHGPFAAPVFQLQPWSRADIRQSTNCYAYAADCPFGHAPRSLPMPGEASGVRLAHVAVTVADVAALATMDGFEPMQTPADGSLPQPPAGRYLVALMHEAAGNGDIHWMRQDNDGIWSHKPGHRAVSQYDDDETRIRDPRRAWFTRPMTFAGFFHAPFGGLRVGLTGRTLAEVQPRCDAGPQTRPATRALTPR